MDNAAHASEERLKLALKAGGLASWDWNIRTGQVAWSDEHFRIQGYRPGEVIPSFEAWLARVHPDDRDEAVQVLQAARDGGADYAHRFRCMLPDGSVRMCAARGFFYYDEAGQATRMIGVMEDITEALAAERRLRESEARFRQFGDASSDVLWIRDAHSLRLEYLSPAFDRIYGLDHRRMLEQPELDGWLALIVPEDRHTVHAALQRVKAGERVTTEYRIRRGSDGSVRWMRNTKFPLRDDAGEIVRIGGIGHDATAEREASDRMHVMMAELQHRTRNLMAVVQSVALRTLRGCASLEQFETAYMDRLAAIARVHGLLSRLPEGDRASFDELLREELQAHGVSDEQVDLQGPSGIRLRSSSLQIFALALHELATNAVKYGALSTPAGRLSIHWALTAWPEEANVLRVQWVEEGVAVDTAAAAAAGGYGRELIERALPHQLRARTSYLLAADGVRCTLEVPLATDA